MYINSDEHSVLMIELHAEVQQSYIDIIADRIFSLQQLILLFFPHY